MMPPKGKGKGKKKKTSADEPHSSDQSMGQRVNLEDEMGALNLQSRTGTSPSTSSCCEDTGVETEFNTRKVQDIEKSFASRNSPEYTLAKFESVTGLRLGDDPNSGFCCRPKFESGKLGIEHRLRTNFYRLTVKKMTVFLYDVDFLRPKAAAAVPQEQEIGRRFGRISKRSHQALLQKFVSTTGGALFTGISYAYDSARNLITSSPLAGINRQGEIFSFEMPEGDDVESGRYFIRIQKTVQVTLSDAIDGNRRPEEYRQMLQVMDIIGKSAAFRNQVVYGSKIFYADLNLRKKLQIGRDGLRPSLFEVAFGYHQSTTLTEKGPMQVIDRANCVMYKGGPLIDSMCIALRVGSPQQIRVGMCLRRLEDLNQLRIETYYRGYICTHTLRRFEARTANEIFFDHNGEHMSVEGYFRNRYAINLRFPNLPCVVVSNNNYIPAELCSLVHNQRYQRKLPDELIRALSKYTVSRPSLRSQESLSAANEVSRQLVQQRQLGIELIPKQVTVESRVLQTPQLQYRNGRCTPKFGQWNLQRRSLNTREMRQFFEGVVIERWAIVFLDLRMDEFIATSFQRSLVEMSVRLGMNINGYPERYEIFGPQMSDQKIESRFREFAKRRMQLVVVMLPASCAYYGLVKYLGDKIYSIATQCVSEKQFGSWKGSRGNARGRPLFPPDYMGNLLLKINTKLGGTNVKLAGIPINSILDAETMVVGIDVNHPSPGENCPSIAAVVGSLSSDFMTYGTEVYVNPERQEMVRVVEMLTSIIMLFKKKRGLFPKRIIVYRDGVSEGQFAAVLLEEIWPLSEKLKTIPGGGPELIYIIVQKRHNVRFFPDSNHEDDVTKSGNILPGSVVDTDIVHYKWAEFYLCSHNALLGTARPGKYTVLWNSGHASTDDLQMATYHLCHLFSRATKSISDPAPVRYAHHAATRGKVHFREVIGRRGWPEGDLTREMQQAINMIGDFKSILYFI